jgi:Icc-related predicted phosphoesterase
MVEKMKIAVCSDLHLEFGDLDLKNTEQADVLVLSGDICVAADMRDRDPYGIMETAKSNRYQQFFQRCSQEFPNVVYVLGNHEHYHGDFAYSYNILKSKLEYLQNIHVLEKETVKIDDVTFIGGTLWTDMNKGDPLTLHQISRMMNDFQCVKNSNRVVYRTVPVYEYNADGSLKKDEKGHNIQTGTKKKAETSRFSPEDAMEEHRRMLDYTKIVLKKDEKFVFCGHHTPSHQSCHPYYSHDTVMNGGYHSSLEEFILDHPEIKLWTHGHTHNKYDYMIGDTRVVCNPRGYVRHEKIADEFELKFVES